MEDLEELDWESYRQRYGNIQRLDRILEAEGRSVNGYQASKQPDVLMLFYLLSADELRDLLGDLGYPLEPEVIPRTIEYYLSRTSHGSTLSALVHAWVLARAHRDQSLEYFKLLLESDVADVQGGTTAEGIHLAAMAGSVDLLQRCFTGLETRGGVLRFNPQWPEKLGTFTCRLRFRQNDIIVRISSTRLRVSAVSGDVPEIQVCLRRSVAHSAAGGVGGVRAAAGMSLGSPEHRRHGTARAVCPSLEAEEPGGYRSLPAYERLKLLLVTGKSGTIVPARASGSAGQLNQDGSTILARVRRPCGVDLDAVDDGAAPALDDADPAAHARPGIAPRFADPVRRRAPEAEQVGGVDEVGGELGGGRELAGAQGEAGQDVPAGLGQR